MQYASKAEKRKKNHLSISQKNKKVAVYTIL